MSETAENTSQSVHGADTMEVHICMGTGGVAAGGREVFKAFEQGIEELKLEAEVKKKLKPTGCRGLCAKDVLVDIYVPGIPKETYTNVLDKHVPDIIEQHLTNKTPVKKLLAKKDYHQFYEKQKRQVLAQCGVLDAESIDDYLEAGGYKALEKALMKHIEETVRHFEKAVLKEGRTGTGLSLGRQ